MCSNMSSVATHTRKFFSGFGVFVFSNSIFQCVKMLALLNSNLVPPPPSPSSVFSDPGILRKFCLCLVAKVHISPKICCYATSLSVSHTDVSR